MTELPNLKDWKVSVDQENIAWAVFDREGESANSLGRRPLEELGQIVEFVAKGAADKSVRGLVFLSGKEKGFIVGADIREFDQLDTEAKVIEGIRPVNAMLDRLEKLPVPVVAAIHGVCVGGGLELILACHYRIATRDDSTRVGFPEVKLGIFPGFNGTARSIHQAGAMQAMTIMLTGSMIRSSAARAMGLIDELVNSPLQLRWAARKAVMQKRRSKPASGWKALPAKWPARGFLAKKMREQTAAKVREDHYPAPFRLIDLFETHGGDLDALKKAETAAFAPLMVSETSRNLRRVFALSEQLKAQAPKGLGFRPQRVHVIGAGTMGADIAGWCVASGMEVTLQDLNAEAITKGIAAQGKTLARKFKTKAQRDAAKARLIADPKGEGIGRADVVIEAIVERQEVKQSLFKSIEGRLKPGAVMASNTSSIMIEDIAKGLADPGRLIGIHFFNPVAQMPLVEIVRGATISRRGSEQGCGLRHRHRQVPADRQKRAGLPRQSRARALHDGGDEAAGGRRDEGEDRRGGAHFRHADGADRTRRYRRPRRVRPRRQDSRQLIPKARRLTGWWRPASLARSRARASMPGRTASRSRASSPPPSRRWNGSAANWSNR